jgi:hypothetical protein
MSGSQKRQRFSRQTSSLTHRQMGVNRVTPRIPSGTPPTMHSSLVKGRPGTRTVTGSRVASSAKRTVPPLVTRVRRAANATIPVIGSPGRELRGRSSSCRLKRTQGTATLGTRVAVQRYIHWVNDRVAPDEVARRLEQLLGPTT